MSAQKPTVFLLVEITGSGKTTYARELERRGTWRLSVDEEVHRLHGRYGGDYHESEYFEKERPVVEEIYRQLAGLVAAGRDAGLGHGTTHGLGAVNTTPTPTP